LPHGCASIAQTQSSGPQETVLNDDPDCVWEQVTQHMAHEHVRSFAERVNGSCEITVKVAEHGERRVILHRARPFAFVAGSILTLAYLSIELDAGPPVS
jgi:hypothetical protein